MSEVAEGYINIVEKVWGVERWITNNELYCAKILEIDPGGCSSLHYHGVKDETFYVLEGSCYLEIAYLGARNLEVLYKFLQKLEEKQSVHIKPQTGHRFFCNRDMKCKILEVSTPHDDADVVRLEESKRI